VNPVALQIPGREQEEFVIAKNQPQYIPLPATVINTHEGVAVVTRWRPTAEELHQLFEGADVWITHLTFGGKLQPLKVGTTCPEEALNAEPT
jgi:hypothetical protein